MVPDIASPCKFVEKTKNTNIYLKLFQNFDKLRELISKLISYLKNNKRSTRNIRIQIPEVREINKT